MKLDWSRRVKLEDQDVIFTTKRYARRPRVTIGMPTFRRGHLVRRALTSIAAQTYRDFVLIISDNAGKDPETIAALKEFSTALPEVILIAQERNIGAIENLNFLLAAAETEYFMWLADDDEISNDYLEDLVRLLDSDQTAVTAVGLWLHQTSPAESVIRTQLRPDDTQRLFRIFKFVAGKADDSAFYGLHRTNNLRKCQFKGYLPPNRGILTNWCYLFLFDMLWQGRFSYSNNCSWIYHGYTEKKYNRSLAQQPSDRLKTLLRRINIYAIYVGKTARKKPVFVPVILAASLIGLTRDIVGAIGRFAERFAKPLTPESPGDNK